MVWNICEGACVITITVFTLQMKKSKGLLGYSGILDLIGKELIIKALLYTSLNYAKAGNLAKDALAILLPHPHPVVR